MNSRTYTVAGRWRSLLESDDLEPGKGSQELSRLEKEARVGGAAHAEGA